MVVASLVKGLLHWFPFVIPFTTVDGSEIRRLPVEVGSFSHYLQFFIHPRWLFGISSINSICNTVIPIGSIVMANLPTNLR